MAEIDTRKIPRAHATQIYSCGDPKCNRPHVIFFNQAGEPMLHAIYSIEMTAELVKFQLGTGFSHDLGELLSEATDIMNEATELNIERKN